MAGGQVSAEGRFGDQTTFQFKCPLFLPASYNIWEGSAD